MPGRPAAERGARERLRSRPRRRTSRGSRRCPRSTTVRQGPAQAIDAPMRDGRGIVGGGDAQRARRSARGVTASTSPTSVTMPVNIISAFRSGVIRSAPKRRRCDPAEARATPRSPRAAGRRAPAPRSAPSVTGLRKRITSSTRSASTSERATCAPPSTRTRVIPSPGEARRGRRRDRRPSGRARDATKRRDGRLPSRRPAGASCGDRTSRSGALPSRTCAAPVSASRPPGRGRRGPASDRSSPGSRTVSRGSSTSDRADADEDRVEARAERLHMPPGDLAGDGVPALARAGRSCRRRRPRASASHAGGRAVTRLSVAGMGAPRASLPSTPASTAIPAAASRASPWPATRGSGSAIGGDDARDAGGDQRVGAGRRPAVMRAGLERDIERGAARRFAGLGAAPASRHAAGRRRPCGRGRRPRAVLARRSRRPTGLGQVVPRPRAPRRSAAAMKRAVEIAGRFSHPLAGRPSSVARQLAERTSRNPWPRGNSR